ncbi:CoA-binding protein [Candidatus Halobonum tyrrellensis]|uniref:CoA-binding domain-containing protein n=1 Tax=Candidatus Halobonum tyrrellensis G22 TaxID=1324957 RepID=V4GSI7_9EURY|nr:CoA-binding protein [Candidatus Halobonum tyrrellensis]ESP88056.1 CoA-binding domain-containing protein [Candidatus Halobonum tyrrellensis G22]
MPVTDDEGLRELLLLDPVAVIGCSSTPGKAAHDIPAYLADHGYEVVPVNPYADEILGEEAYDSLADVEEDVRLVDVFRPDEEVAGIVEEVVERREARGDVEGVWLQLGITDDGALARAEDAGLTTTQDRCMKVEHGRLLG